MIFKYGVAILAIMGAIGFLSADYVVTGVSCAVLGIVFQFWATAELLHLQRRLRERGHRDE